LAKLLTFDAAQNWLTSRVNVPTGMSAAQLAMAPDFPAQVRMHAFFSAKVAQVDVLDELRQEIDRYMAGGTNMAGARERLKNFLARQGVAHPDDVAEAEEPPAGVSPDDWKARKQITNLASTRRLNLILEQNANMAHAIGQREVSMQPAVQQRWPYYRYIAVQDGNARDSHAALHNMVLRKDDPFWATHTPPWEFGCRCQLEDCDAEEAAQYGGVAQAVTHEQPDGAQTATVQSGAGQTVNVLPSPSGFVFRPAEAYGTFDMDRIPDLSQRRNTLTAMLSQADGADIPVRFRGQSTAGEASRPPPHLDTIRTVLAEIAASPTKAALPQRVADLGPVLSEHAEALGLPLDGAAIRYSSPGAAKYGASHEWDHHRDMLRSVEGKIRIWKNTIWNPGAEVMLASGRGRRLVAFNRDGNELTILRRVGENWDIEIVSTWEQVPEQYKREIGL